MPTHMKAGHCSWDRKRAYRDWRAPRMELSCWSPAGTMSNEQKTKASAKRMNYVSAQLMAGRDKGTHPSYLHRLYAEGLEAFEKKRRQVQAVQLCNHDSSTHGT